MGFSQAKQSTTKYHFPGTVNFGIAGPRCRGRMKRSSTANPGAAHHHNRPDAPRNDAARNAQPNRLAILFGRLISVTSLSGAREVFVSLDIDQRCVGQPLA